MKCLSCNKIVFFEVNSPQDIGYTPGESFSKDYLILGVCPSCCEKIVFLARNITDVNKLLTTFGHINLDVLEKKGLIRRIFPVGSIRNCPQEVPEEIKKDFSEASQTIDFSINASAALSRRCLQNILRNHFGVKEKTLFEEIKKVKNKLPNYISEQLAILRVVGNFAAHPDKDQNTGFICDAEVGEAELCLDILELLFDHCFVNPAKSIDIRNKVNKKLQSMGKKPIELST